MGGFGVLLCFVGVFVGFARDLGTSKCFCRVFLRFFSACLVPIGLS